MNFKVIFHKSLSIQHGIEEKYEKHLDENLEVIDAIKETLKNTNAFHLIFDENNKFKTGFLFISKGTELLSTKQINEKIKKYPEIKIIPIYHGG